MEHFCKNEFEVESELIIWIWIGTNLGDNIVKERVTVEPGSSTNAGVLAVFFGCDIVDN